MGPDLGTVRSYILDFLKNKLDNYLHRNAEVAEIIQKKILRAEKERKELAGIQKLARERAKKASLHNKKLRDCRQHYNDQKADSRLETTIFITEGDSASDPLPNRGMSIRRLFSV